MNSRSKQQLLRSATIGFVYLISKVTCLVLSCNRLGDELLTQKYFTFQTSAFGLEGREKRTIFRR